MTVSTSGSRRAATATGEKDARGKDTGEKAARGKTRDEAEARCPHRLVLEHLTSRWGVLVLIALLDRSYRFSELRRAIVSVRPVSEKMLTQTLQTLERDGLVHREAQPVIPPRVDYSLTWLGREAAGQVRELAGWTERRMAAVLEARAAYDEGRG